MPDTPKKVLPFAPKPAPGTDPPVASDYRLYPVFPNVPATDYIISRALLDLVLLHLVGGDVAEDQRKALAQEMVNLSGLTV